VLEIEDRMHQNSRHEDMIRKQPKEVEFPVLFTTKTISTSLYLSYGSFFFISIISSCLFLFSSFLSCFLFHLHHQQASFSPLLSYHHHCVIHHSTCMSACTSQTSAHVILCDHFILTWLYFFLLSQHDCYFSYKMTLVYFKL